jgi:regulator of sirC expression with transglutaminase-like and TPR domain
VDFREYAAQADDRLELLTGAILVASDAYPGLNVAALNAEISGLSSAIDRARLARLPPTAQARVLSDHLYVACGFHGNDSVYYDPRNSYLNEVLSRRTGIPITLAIVYIEVARRLGVPASPVGFPGHFLVRIDDGDRRVIVDPFHGGRVLSDAALAKLLRRTGYKQPFVPEMLAPTPVRHVIARILMNLRGVYSMLGDSARVLVVLDRLIDLLPENAEELRDRGLLLGRLGAPEWAASDLKRYAERLPHAGDIPEVRRWIERFESTHGRSPPH